MFLHSIVMRIRGLMGCQSTELSTEVEQPLNSAKTLPVKSGRQSKVAQAPAKRKPKQSKKVAPKATQGKSSKQEPKPVRKTSGQKARKTHA